MRTILHPILRQLTVAGIFLALALPASAQDTTKSDATAKEAAKGHRPHLAHLFVGMHFGAKKVGTKDGRCKNETGGKNEASHRPTPTSPAAAPSAKSGNWMPTLDRASFDAVRVRRNRGSRKKHGTRV